MSLIVFLFGTLVGSFLNVCIFRIPANRSIVFPGSSCPYCAKPIRWFDNIPCLSFLALRGRCRDCGAKISPQYFVIEFLTGTLFAVFYGRFGATPIAAIYLVLTLALLVESAIDWRHEIIPDRITLPGMLLGVVVSAVLPSLHGEETALRATLQSLGGLLLGGGFLYLAAVAAEAILKKEAMGGGDVKLLAMMGAFLGWRGVLWTVFVSSLLGSVVGVYLRLTKGRERIPFGPFLGAAAVLYIFFGEVVIRWYSQAMGLERIF